MVDLIHGLKAADVSANLARVQEQLATAGRDPRTVEILAAVKYLPEPELDALQQGGVTLAGENRAQALADKAPKHPQLTWDFIGQLQSRKVPLVLPYVRYIHSVASDSALSQLGKHGTADTKVLIEVNVAGEQAKSGVAPQQLKDFIDRCPVQVVGLMTMPPYAEHPEDSRRYFARLAELAAEHDLSELSMGTSQDYAVAAQEGATIIRLGSTLFAPITG